MARGMVLQKIKPFHPELKPPPGAIPFGRTADGKHQLYRMTSKRSRAVPRFVQTPAAKAREEALKAEGKTVEQIREILQAEGFREYRKNQQTGEIAYPLNQPEIYDLEEIFYLISEGNGNVRKEPYRPPSEAQLAAERRRLQVQALGGGRLAELLVDEGITAEEVVGAIKSRRAPSNGNDPVASEPPKETEPGKPAGPTYPRSLGGGWWQLSSGEKFQGKKDDAEKQEASLPPDMREAAAAAKADTEAVPEF